jgi:hypothetical protein
MSTKRIGAREVRAQLVVAEPQAAARTLLETEPLTPAAQRIAQDQAGVPEVSASNRLLRGFRAAAALDSRFGTTLGKPEVAAVLAAAANTLSRQRARADAIRWALYSQPTLTPSAVDLLRADLAATLGAQQTRPSEPAVQDEDLASQRYGEHWDRSRNGEPFPDGVVDSDFVFRNYFHFLDVTALTRLLSETAAVSRLGDLMHRAKVAPVILADGSLATRTDDRLDLTWSGVAWQVDVQEDALCTTWVVRSQGEEANLEVDPRVASPDQAASAAKRVSWDHYFDGKAFRLQEFQGGFPVLSGFFAALAAGLGCSVDLAAIDVGAEKSRVTAEYLRGMHGGAGAVGLLSEIAATARRLDAIALGDDDLFISIADRMERTKEVDGVDEDIVLVEGRGPLLTYDNVASGASFAVELEALARGELVAHRFYYNDRAGVIRLDSAGNTALPISEIGIASFVFDMEWSLTELKKRIQRP